MYTTLKKERIYKTEQEALYHAVDEHWNDLISKLTDKKIWFLKHEKEPVVLDIMKVVEEVKEIMKDFSPTVIKINFEE
jgi:hypothetical protein